MYSCNKVLPKYTTSIIAIVLFWILVVTPYIFGMSTAIYEKDIICSKDYKSQKVDLITVAEKLKNVAIIKTTSKGVLIRIFKENNSTYSNYIMVHWNDIRRIITKINLYSLLLKLGIDLCIHLYIRMEGVLSSSHQVISSVIA